MPKIKSKKAAAKRFKATGNGKFKYFKANKQHILGKKSSKRKMKLRKGAIADKTNELAIRRMLPYS
ncbi:MAG: 50S ribosomal protein L35 [Firmicutes bacterium]|nr:50S ribosomal protein L35 [Bacillota bacterium]